MTTDETINVSYAIYDKNGSFSKIAGTAFLSETEGGESLYGGAVIQRMF
ncbi:MAG: hypothetical protein J6M62_04590 [Selenomonadaceae bacterium]|nr:hypothetical protein [Selenomonadaceae bacterium]